MDQLEPQVSMIPSPTGAPAGPPRGFPGPDGPAGAPGVDGIIGHQGHKGMQGYDGAKGEQGEIGAPGSAGEPGGPGDGGLKGLQGPRGAPGPAGPAGGAGGPGPMGSTGARGSQGARGEAGMQGEGGTRLLLINLDNVVLLHFQCFRSLVVVDSAPVKQKPERCHGNPNPFRVGLLQLAHLRGLLHPKVDLAAVVVYPLQLDVLSLITHRDSLDRYLL